MLGIIKAEQEAIKKAISQAIAKPDIVLSSGGVSVVDYYFVEKMLESLGGEIKVRSVAMKPGKPLTVATFNIPNAPSGISLTGDAALTQSLMGETPKTALSHN